VVSLSSSDLRLSRGRVRALSLLRLAFCRPLGLFALAVSQIALRAADPTVIALWPEGVPGLHADASPEKQEKAGRISNIHNPTLTMYAPAAGTANGTAIIICPGGGYMRLAIEPEGVAPARWFNSIGVTAFVLKYRLQEYGHPAPLQDVLRAIRVVRSRSSELGIRPERVGVIGFSSGGHLAASAGTFFDSLEGRTGAPLDSTSARPDFLVLLYPVISLEGPYASGNSLRALLGANPPPESIHHLSLDRQVTKAMPPVFLCQAADDASVPVESSLTFYLALHQAGVPVEFHVYPTGGHGFGFRPNLGPTSSWPDRCADWMRSNGWLPPPPESARSKTL
jgi:acetyl esterase/lipase